MKFREHRGGLAESMGTVVEVRDRDALVSHLRALLGRYSVYFHDMDFKVEAYVKDERIGWDTHIVTLAGYGVLGFTDGPCSTRNKGVKGELYPCKPDIFAATYSPVDEDTP